MWEQIEPHLFGIFVVASPLIFGALFCLFLWKTRRSFTGRPSNGLVWLSSFFK